MLNYVIVGIVFIVLAALFLAVAGAFFAVHLLLTYGKKCVGRTGGFLYNAKHKKNVTWHSFGPRGPSRSLFFKDLTKGKYRYTVNKRSYTVRDLGFCTEKQMPYSVSVTYLKRFPRFAFVTDKGSEYWLSAFIALTASVCFLICAIPILT